MIFFSSNVSLLLVGETVGALELDKKDSIDNIVIDSDGVDDGSIVF